MSEFCWCLLIGYLLFKAYCVNVYVIPNTLVSFGWGFECRIIANKDEGLFSADPLAMLMKLISPPRYSITMEKLLAN